MIVGLLAMLFMVLLGFIVLARAERQTLRLVARGEQVQSSVQSIEDLAIGAIGGRQGVDLVTGANYVNIPGYAGTDAQGNPWGAPWLASPEPVRTPGGGTNPIDYQYPALTSLSQTPAVNRTLPSLMANSEDSVYSPNAVVIEPGDPCTPSSPDTVFNTQNPFTDADGDGIADSSFADVALITELANGAAGRPSRAQGVRPDLYNPALPDDPNSRFWTQFRENARYAASMRVKSHGGMVQLAAEDPNDLSVRWPYLERMFEWVRDPNDPNLSTIDPNALLALSANRGAIEPLLRRRGGLLLGRQEGAATALGIPPALATLEEWFGQTFVPRWNQGASPGYYKEFNWQRFNLADLKEWNVWRQGVTLDAGAYNSNPAVRNLLVSRPLLTTASYSDERARLQERKDDLTTWGQLGQLGLRPGALKYYLGRITDLSVPPVGGTGVPRGAFKTDGKFNDDTPLMASGTIAQGFVVVRELADYYHEMLAGHKDFPDLTGDPSLNDDMRRRRQAYMLAVNTVAFAAPRDVNGDIDVPYYDDLQDPNGPIEYVGYVPQPLITQVAVYNKPALVTGQFPPMRGPRIAAAIELYNPNDSRDPGSPPQPADYGLNLGLYAISFNDDTLDPAAGGLFNLSNVQPPIDDYRLDGRSFMVFRVHDGAAAPNTWFEDNLGAGLHGELNTLTVGYPAPPNVNVAELRVKLWRQNLAGTRWFLVDEMELDSANLLGNQPVRKCPWLLNMWRDTSYENYLGAQVGPFGVLPARWRMTVAFPCDNTPHHNADLSVNVCNPNDPNDPLFDPNVPGLDTLPSELGFGALQSSDQVATDRLEPCVPLYLMNAGFANEPSSFSVALHGTARPASFPTVGFLLYVPRVSHVWNNNVVAQPQRRPVTRVLYDAWQDENYNYVDPRRYPRADFGHLPSFDNTQDIETTAGNQALASGLDETGAVPWGLLVFDYFTTLDPNASNPDRVPGRIDINTAGWYVLAGAPLIGPQSSTNPNTSLPSALADTGAAPAFWSWRSGIVTGLGANATTIRFPAWSRVNNSSTSSGEWYRLGPTLAQAATAYRDRLVYVAPGTAPLARAAYRNNWAAGSVYRPTRYDTKTSSATDSPRGALDDAMNPNSPNVALWKRGFLTLGELANVVGFDGSSDAELAAGMDATVLGGYAPSRPWLGGDFMKAVSLLALLDTQFLTTRSNTFTVYTTLIDREQPAQSASSVVTIDRSNLLPRLVWQDGTGIYGNEVQDPPNPADPTADRYTLIQPGGKPEVIARREFPYYGARYDE